MHLSLCAVLYRKECQMIGLWWRITKVAGSKAWMTISCAATPESCFAPKINILHENDASTCSSCSNRLPAWICTTSSLSYGSTYFDFALINNRFRPSPRLWTAVPKPRLHSSNISLQSLQSQLLTVFAIFCILAFTRKDVEMATETSALES